MIPRASTARRTGFALVATVLVFVLAGVAIADVAVFGVHEHVADRDNDDLSAQAQVVDLHTTHHHCDLSMNPGEVAPAPDLAVPLGSVGALREPESPGLRDVSFVPLLPPRS